MPTFIGYSSINANKPRSTQLPEGVDGGTGSLVKPIISGKKFRLVDEQLVLQDFLNALNIRKGQKVGQPDYGCAIWDYLFDPNTTDLQTRLEDEIIRIGNQDPRLIINTVKAYPKENGILLEVELAVNPFNNPQLLSVFFDAKGNKASVQ